METNAPLAPITIDQVTEYIPGFVEEYRTDHDALLVRLHRMEAFHDTLSVPTCYSHHELCIPLTGTSHVERQTDGVWERGRLTRGALLLNPSGPQQNWRWNASFDLLLLYLHDDVLRQAARSTNADPTGVQLIERFLTPDPLVDQIGLTLQRELRTGALASRLYAESAAQLLAVHLLRNHCTVTYRVTEYTGGLPPYRLRRVLDYIHANLAADLSLEDLAQVVELSPYHFARMFKQAVGLSPYKYVVQQRMERAKRLLHETGLPLVEVAYHVGYSSQSHFTRLFRRTVGVTPMLFRKQR